MIGFKTAAALAVAGAIGAGAVLAAAPAHARPDPDLGPNCDTVLWGFLGSQRRTICDGPVQPDGSWERKRSVWTPAHQVPTRTSCYGRSYVSCTTYGGYFVDMKINDREQYTVTPDTVLPDEPGHLPG